MGGPGSGRHTAISAKSTTRDYIALDVRRLHRRGRLTPGVHVPLQWSGRLGVRAKLTLNAEREHLVLIYGHRTRDSKWASQNLTVRLEWTPCHYGGKRPWFICPTAGCGRRVALLYGGGRIACRHCHDLAYPSQRQSIDDRWTTRLERIRARLKWRPGLLNGGYTKPKGMHWRTFGRLLREHDELAQKIVRSVNIQLGLLPKE